MQDFIAIHPTAQHDSTLSQYLKEFNRRRVGHAITTYAVAMWMVLQIADICVPLLALPDWTMSVIVMLGLPGFPLVIALAWIFQVTEQGVVIDAPPGNVGRRPEQRQPALSPTLKLLACALTVLTSVQLVSTWY
jgi:hypothetical protein